jgi:uncharacterized membrane protein YcaP (DUF421 family)
MTMPQTSLLEVVLRSACVYLALMLTFRFLGKRELGQFTPFDFVLLLVLANAVQNAMVGDNNSLAGGLTAAGTLVTLHAIFVALTSRSSRLRRALEGTPTVLLRHGVIHRRALKQERLDQDDVMAALREHGYYSPKQVELALLELDGSISVIGAHAIRPHDRRRRQGSRLRARLPRSRLKGP